MLVIFASPTDVNVEHSLLKGKVTSDAMMILNNDLMGKTSIE